VSIQASIFTGDRDPRGFIPALVMDRSRTEYPSEIDGYPVRYFWKEALPLGRIRDANGKEEEVPPQRVDTILRDYQRARAKGYKAFLPPGHKDRSKNYGWVLDARKNANGALELLHQVIGEDAILEVVRSDSSICTLRDVTDAQGDHYDELIDHNAIIPDPQHPGLGGFVAFEPGLAASRGQPLEAEVFRYMTAAQQMESDMDLKDLKAALGLPDDAKDADVLAKATARIKEVPTIEQARDTAAQQVTALSRERDDAKTELSRRPAAPFVVDPEALRDRADLVLGRIDLVTDRGDMPKFIADKVKAKVKSDKGEPNAFMLSRAAELDARPIDFVLSLFDGSKLGLELGRQTTRTPTNAPVHGGDGQDDNKPVTKDRVAELAGMAGVAVK
jgi:hypothetical protein